MNTPSVPFLKLKSLPPMQLLPFTLVLISIFTHAYWNYLTKRSENKHIFTALSKLSEVLIFGAGAIYFLIVIDFKPYFFFLVIVAAIFTFLNYFFLSSAYKYGTLSLVYPISRSSVLFLPIFAYFFIGETINITGILSIGLILLGTFIIHFDSFTKEGIYTIFKNLNNKGTIYAFFAAIAVAGYTVWDKISITEMEPFLYFYMYTFIVACFYNTLIFTKYSKKEIKKEWIKNKSRILQVGFFNSFTYLLILMALAISKATYVGGLRQLSIAVGVFFGYKFLGEKLGTPQIVGILTSLLGGGMIYWAK